MASKASWTCPICGFIEIVKIKGISLEKIVSNHIGYHILSGNLGQIPRKASKGMPRRQRKRKPKFVVSIRDFGASGDGFSDDTQAFIAALKSRAVRIKVPPGSYQIHEDLELDHRFISVGRP